MMQLNTRSAAHSKNSIRVEAGCTFLAHFKSGSTYILQF